jgi:hypothetical protein
MFTILIGLFFWLNISIENTSQIGLLQRVFL